MTHALADDHDETDRRREPTGGLSSARERRRRAAQPSDPHEVGDDGGFNLQRALNTVWRGKWTVLIAVLVCAAAAFVNVKQRTPIYTATSVLLIEGDRQNVIDMQAVVAGVDFSYIGLTSEAEILRSDQLADRVIAKLRLDRDPEFNGRLAEADPGLVRRVISGISTEAERLIFGEVFTEANAAETPARSEETALAEPRRRMADEPLTDEELAPIRAAFKDRLLITQQRAAQIIRVSFKSTNRQKAALIANTIAEQYIVDQLEARFEGTQRATLWLNERLESLRVRVVDAEQSVETFRANLAEESGVSMELTQQQLAQLNASLVEARANRAEAEARFESVRQLAAAGRDLSSAAEVRTAGQTETLRAKLTDLRRREAELETRYGPRHPTMINLRAEISDTRAAIRNESQRSLEVMRNAVEVARAREESLQESVDAVQGTSLAQGQAAVRLRELEREAEATRTLYENFLNRFKETSETEDLQEAEARVIAKAEAPNVPSEPSTRRALLSGSLIGGLAGLGFIFLMERLNNTFRSRADLEARSGLPVIAQTPVVRGSKDRRDVFRYFMDRPNSALAEAVRNLRTSLLLSDVDNPPRVVLVTSSVPSEGKSSLSLMLAMTSARMGKPTVIVDCDMRRPTLSGMFPSVEGDLVGVLSGETALQESIARAESGDPLFGIPTSVAKGNPADLLSSQRFKSLVQKLSEHYEMVVLDSPPVTVVTDARILSTIADVTILSVRWDDTPTELVLEAVELLESVDANVSGTVLSLVDEKQMARYSYGYRGRYGRYYDAGSSYYTN